MNVVSGPEGFEALAIRGELDTEYSIVLSEREQPLSGGDVEYVGGLALQSSNLETHQPH